MASSRRREIAVLALLVTSLMSCADSGELTAAGGDEPTPTPTPTSTDADAYCAALGAAVEANTDGAPSSQYDDLLRQAILLGPAEHEMTWTLMLQVSEEPFTYDNFNPAVDSYEMILGDLVERCPAMDRAVIDDGGRMAHYGA